MKDFSIIVACDEQGGIGRGGVMPWHVPADLKHFKDITTAAQGDLQNVLIMGRKTWESLPERFRPLPGRHNVVITSQRMYALPEGVSRTGSLDEAIDLFCKKENKKMGCVFVIGGGRVFAEAIGSPLCTKIYMTTIYDNFDCDVKFPSIPVQFKEKEFYGKYEESKKTFSFSVFVRVPSK